ncbi:hypothetical protein ABPG72_002592 [Tetrahymena utriculariae]
MKSQKQSNSYLKDLLNSDISSDTSLELLLSDKKLNDEDLQSLSSILEKCNNLLSLNLELSYNNIGKSGVLNLVQGLEKCIQLLSLELWVECKVDDQDSQNMYSFLAKYTNLQTIKLYLESNKMDAWESVSILGSGLYKCIRLYTLKLYFFYGLTKSQKDKLIAKIYKMKRLVKKQFYL